MLNRSFTKTKQATALLVAFMIFVIPISAFAETQIKLRKNKYKIQDDVKIGQEVAADAEKQLPVLNDSVSTQYLQNLGRRLVEAIPPQYQQPAFRYNFKIVNVRDVNAFALPGGPMYVNRGLIDIAKNEGELAGVMAHEISHVALRHGTAQATKQQSATSILTQLGAIIGGGILLGETGAQLGALAAGAYLLKFSREYETEADILGAQILARADYDPQDLANMFRTLEQQGGSNRLPQWLSSHPNPKNRYERINQEIALLRVSPNPIRDSRDFQRTKERLRSMPAAPSSDEIAKQNPNTGNTGGNDNYGRVSAPSSRYRTYNGGNLFSVSMPDNWRVVEGQDSVTLHPNGAYGSKGITHGVMAGLAQTRNQRLRQASDEYISGLLQGNPYLRQQSEYNSGYIDNRDALAMVLAGKSDLTGQTEIVTVYTTMLRSGELFYFITVTSENDSSSFNRAFQTMLRSIRIND